MRRGARLGALVAISAILAACGGNSEPGDQSGSAPPPIVSADKLDVGKFQTEPRPPMGNAGNPAAGVIVDAQRLANYVIGPWDVEEEIVTPYLTSAFLLTSPQALRQLGPIGIGAAAARHGMIDGFASARQVTDELVLINSVLRFPSPESAAAASAGMNTAGAQQQIQGATPAPIAIPNHDGTAAVTYPFTPKGAPQPWAAIRAFTPHGPFVLMQVVQAKDGADRAAELVGKTVDKQIPRLDEFDPAPADKLADAPLDPTGLLARTLPAPPNSPETKNAVYQSSGALHFQSNPVGSATLFSDNGVDEVVMAGTNVYQARDEASAKWVADSFGVEVDTEGVAPADPVPALPGSRCLKFPKEFYCVVSAGRYAVEAQAPQLTDVHQLTAAQYVLLTAQR